LVLSSIIMPVLFTGTFNRKEEQFSMMIAKLDYHIKFIAQMY